MKAKSLLLLPVLLPAFYTDGVWASVPLPGTSAGGIGVEANYTLTYSPASTSPAPVPKTAYAIDVAPGAGNVAMDRAKLIPHANPRPPPCPATPAL
jgi:hypothetical protein